MNKYTKITDHLVDGTARSKLEIRATSEHGSQSNLPNFYRFVVLETIFDPTIIDSDRAAYYEHVLGVGNMHYVNVLPRNTIIARRVLDANTSASASSLFLFPFFPPNLALPCQPGEHVWVMFENQDATRNDLGFWFCRIVEPGFVEDVNHTHPPRRNDPSFLPGTVDHAEGTDVAKYEFRNGKTGIRSDDQKDRYTIVETATISGPENVYETLLTETDASKTMTYEPIPRYRKRPSDVVLEGSNNTLIVMGRDRTGAAAAFDINQATNFKTVIGLPGADISTPGAGAIDLVAGRGQTLTTGGVVVNSTKIDGLPTGFSEIGKANNELVENEGDPDFFSDRSRIYIAQRTMPDTNFGLSLFNAQLSAIQFPQAPITGSNVEKFNMQDSTIGDGAIVIKSDKLRFIARSDVEILVTSFIKRDENDHLISSSDVNDYAVVAIKANGDIVFKPAKTGFIKLGGDDANKGIVCSDVAVSAVDGIISGAPLSTTMGGFFAGAVPSGEDNTTALSSGQAKFANRVLIK